MLADIDITREGAEADRPGEQALTFQFDMPDQTGICTAVPFPGMRTAEDAKNLAFFPASAEADYVAAQTYSVGGGNRMS